MEEGVISSGKIWANYPNEGKAVYHWNELENGEVRVFVDKVQGACLAPLAFATRCFHNDYS